MSNSLAISILLLAFFSSITFNGFFRNIAKKKGVLIDIPDKSRKFHFRATPLTGGIGIFCGILISGLLLTGLTDARYSTNFNDGFLENTALNNGVISKNFEVNDEDYNLSLIQNNEKDGLSVKINPIKNNSAQDNATVNIFPLAENRFKVLLPDGNEKFYESKNGKIYELSNNNSIIQTFTPESTDQDRIKLDNFAVSLYLCALFIMIFMIFDDYFGIRALIRLIFQSLIVLIMIFMTDEKIVGVGDLFGLGDVTLEMFSVAFTVFCVVGLMNAFNMIDGLNGICASLALVPLSFVAFFGNFSYGLLIPIGAIVGFLAYNLGYLGKKRRVFLGDSGSNMLGFAIAFICIECSQDINHASYINPVTALWLVAIPLLDCIVVLISRILKGIMPFRPGRDHLHHRLLDMGFTPKKILLVFISLSIILASLGYYFEQNYPNKEYISFYSFAILSVLYYFVSKTKLEKNV
jgi:UDP-GlcNAc:undecaprenyl-phosphate GlcNAc-1-phosphate transferase